MQKKTTRLKNAKHNTYLANKSLHWHLPLGKKKKKKFSPSLKRGKMSRGILSVDPDKACIYLL